MHICPSGDLAEQLGAEVMRGQYSLPHEADTIIEDSDVLVKICAGLLARYRNCWLSEYLFSRATGFSHGMS